MAALGGIQIRQQQLGLDRLDVAGRVDRSLRVQDVRVVVAADRASTSGDSYIDFEFLQNPLVAKTNGTFSSTGPNGGRTVNDILLSLGFTGGGSVADFSAWRWVTNTSGGGLEMLTTNGKATVTDDLPYSNRLVVRARGGQYCKGWPQFGQRGVIAAVAISITVRQF